MTDRSMRLALLLASPLLVAGSLALAQTAPADDAPPAANTPADAPSDVRPGPARFDRGHDHGPHGGRGGPGPMFELFGEVDADGDGVATAEEIAAFRASQFAAADANGDGAVALDEFATVYFDRTRPMMVDAFQLFDDDGDGVITAAEVETRVARALERFDRDGDGALSRDDRRDRS